MNGHLIALDVRHFPWRLENTQQQHLIFDINAPLMSSIATINMMLLKAMRNAAALTDCAMKDCLNVSIHICISNN